MVSTSSREPAASHVGSTSSTSSLIKVRKASSMVIHRSSNTKNNKNARQQHSKNRRTTTKRVLPLNRDAVIPNHSLRDIQNNIGSTFRTDTTKSRSALNMQDRSADQRWATKDAPKICTRLSDGPRPPAGVVADTGRIESSVTTRATTVRDATVSSLTNQKETHVLTALAISKAPVTASTELEESPATNSNSQPPPTMAIPFVGPESGSESAATMTVDVSTNVPVISVAADAAFATALSPASRHTTPSPTTTEPHNIITHNKKSPQPQETKSSNKATSQQKTDTTRGELEDSYSTEPSKLVALPPALSMSPTTTTLPHPKPTSPAKSLLAERNSWEEKTTLSCLPCLTSPTNNDDVPKLPSDSPRDGATILQSGEQYMTQTTKPIRNELSACPSPSHSAKTSVISKSVKAAEPVDQEAVHPESKQAATDSTWNEAVPEKPEAVFRIPRKNLSQQCHLSGNSFEHRSAEVTDSANTMEATTTLDELSRAHSKTLLWRKEQDVETGNGKQENDELAPELATRMKTLQIATHTTTKVEIERDSLLSPVLWASTCRASEKAALCAIREATCCYETLLCDLGLEEKSVVTDVESSPIVSYRELYVARFSVSKKRFQKKVVGVFWNNLVLKKKTFSSRAFSASLQKQQGAKVYELKVIGLADILKEFRPFFSKWWFSEADRRKKLKAQRRRKSMLAKKKVPIREETNASSTRKRRGKDLTSSPGGLVTTSSIDSSTVLENVDHRLTASATTTQGLIQPIKMAIAVEKATGKTTKIPSIPTSLEAPPPVGVAEAVATLGETMASEDKAEDAMPPPATGIQGDSALVSTDVSKSRPDSEEEETDRTGKASIQKPNINRLVSNDASMIGEQVILSVEKAPLTMEKLKETAIDKSVLLTEGVVKEKESSTLSRILVSGRAPYPCTTVAFPHSDGANIRDANANAMANALATQSKNTVIHSSSLASTGFNMTQATHCENGNLPDVTNEPIVLNHDTFTRLPTGDTSNEAKRPLPTSFHVDFDTGESLGMLVTTHNQGTACIVRSLEPSCVKHPALRPGTRIETAGILEESSISNSIKVDCHRDLKLLYIRASQSTNHKKLRLWLINDNKGLECLNDWRGITGGWDGHIKRGIKEESHSEYQQATAQSSQEMTKTEPQKTEKRVRFAENFEGSTKRRRLENPWKPAPKEKRFAVEKASPKEEQNVGEKRFLTTYANDISKTSDHNVISFLKVVASDTNDWKSQRQVESAFMELQWDKTDRKPLRIARDRVTREGLVEWGRVFLTINAIVEQKRPKKGYGEKSYMKLTQRGVTVLSVGKVKCEDAAVDKLSIKNEEEDDTVLRLFLSKLQRKGNATWVCARDARVAYVCIRSSNDFDKNRELAFERGFVNYRIGDMAPAGEKVVCNKLSFSYAKDAWLQLTPAGLAFLGQSVPPGTKGHCGPLHAAAAS